MSSAGKRLIPVNIAVFILLEVASLYMLYSPEGTRRQWMGKFFTGMQASVWGMVESWGEYFALRSMNERLAQDNFILTEKLFSLEHKMQENAPDPRENYSLTSCCIVTMTTGSQHNYLILDKGAADGVCKDDGVITNRGVAGIVQSVGEHFCYAISLLNADMTVSARAGRSGAVGTFRWDGHATDSGLLSGIPLHFNIQPGDTVFTSGFSSIFPGGIPMGTIVSTRTDSGSSSESQVRMFEDFSSLKYAILIKNTDREAIQALVPKETE